jgi:hypothetical protein
MSKTALRLVGGFICAMAVLLPAFARDNGQWKNSDPAVSRWFRELMRPDEPEKSCCGEADAYWADGVEIKDGRVIAIITDTRPDEPLGRPHVPIGTRIVVPPNKMKWDRGNPTGHIVIFLNFNAIFEDDLDYLERTGTQTLTEDVAVFCYVAGTGV